MVDFCRKIEFLKKYLYDDCDDKLTRAFMPISSPSSMEVRKRKVAVRSWIKDKRKSANFSHEYYKYQISKLHFKDESTVFPLSAFDWKYEKFVKQYEKYLKDKESHLVTIEDYKYIYYYDEDKQELLYFEIEYQEDKQVKLFTHHHSHQLTYVGRVERHTSSSMLHFIVESDDEMMFFSFSKLDLKLKFNVYGLCLSKDFNLKSPKSSIVLLTQNLLTVENKCTFKTKINPSNIMIVDNNGEGIEESFINNLSTHIRRLKSSLDSYSSQNIFLNLFLEEFALFYQQFDGLYNKRGFHLSSFSQSIKIILKLLEQSTQNHRIRMVYTIKNTNKSLFSSTDNASIEMFNLLLQIAKEQQISFEFIILLGRKALLDNALSSKLKQFEEAGIVLSFREYGEVKAYSSVILIDDYRLAISCLKGEKIYTVTNLSSEVNKLKNEYEKQLKHVLSLRQILNDEQILNGKWILYGHNSLNQRNSVIIEIDGLNAYIQYDNKEYKGEVRTLYSDVLICSDFGIIKFKEHEKENVLKIVSFLSDQDYGNRKPMMLFAILSKVELDVEDIDVIFSALVDRENSPYEKASFQLSLHIDTVLRPFLLKYSQRG